FIPIQGGLLHQVWQIKTTENFFAVKAINATLQNLLNPNPDFLITGQKVASLIQAAGIATVTALKKPGADLIFCKDDMTYMVFPWADGEIIDKVVLPASYANKLGKLLAKIHNLKLTLIADLPDHS